MRESLEKLGHSKSAFVRTFYRLVKAGGAIFPATRRDRVKRFVLRVIGYRPKYCRRITGWGLNRSPRTPRVIVSVTSYPGRIRTVHRVLQAMLMQTFKPDKVVLWLGEEKFPNKEADLPKSLLRLRDYGLTIGWCKDLRSYTKLIPALREYPDDIIVTGDDDMFYSQDWLEKLYQAYLNHPDAVLCHCVARIGFLGNGEPTPYCSWSRQVQKGRPSFDNLLLGFGGVLYPPHVLSEEVFDESVFRDITPQQDDLWFWAMAVARGTKIIRIEGGVDPLGEDWCANQSMALRNGNVNGENQNDRRFGDLLARFPVLRNRLRNCLA